MLCVHRQLLAHTVVMEAVVEAMVMVEMEANVEVMVTVEMETVMATAPWAVPYIIKEQQALQEGMAMAVVVVLQWDEEPCEAGVSYLQTWCTHDPLHVKQRKVCSLFKHTRQSCGFNFCFVGNILFFETTGLTFGVPVTGTSGQPVNVTANYFQLTAHTDWIVNQYRVDFSPDVDHIGIRKGLVKVHKESLGGYIFDGTIMFSSHRHTAEQWELISKQDGTNENIRITIRFVKQLLHGDHNFIQLFNIIVRKCLAALNLQLVGRNFFDPIAKV